MTGKPPAWYPYPPFTGWLTGVYDIPARFGGAPAYTLRPPLFYHDAKIIVQYARRLFTGFLGLPRSGGIPPISEAQAEALDALHFLGERYALGLNFQKGDVQYINNLGVFHARDAFVDTPEHTCVPLLRAISARVCGVVWCCCCCC